MVTSRRISSIGGFSAGSASARPVSATRRVTIETSSSSVAGVGSTTALNRRVSALERSFTPLSRLFAVPITLNPRRAWTSIPSSGMGSVFSESIVINVSCTSLGMRVSSSTRAIFPSRMAR